MREEALVPAELEDPTLKVQSTYGLGNLERASGSGGGILCMCLIWCWFEVQRGKGVVKEK